LGLFHNPNQTKTPENWIRAFIFSLLLRSNEKIKQHIRMACAAHPEV
jgi:hypothetical protein